MVEDNKPRKPQKKIYGRGEGSRFHFDKGEGSY